jgi:glycosyltransferase involved in cell wall biosynthesis
LINIDNEPGRLLSETPLRPRLAFIVTEDWFFASHFLPMARAALEAGFEPVVITRVRRHRAVIEAAGARVIPLEAERGSIDPLLAGGAVMRLAALLRRERVTAVHCIALRSIIVGGLAARLSGVRWRLFALTGGGMLAARTDRSSRTVYQSIRWSIRHVLETRRTHYLFENRDDPVTLGLDPKAPNVTIVGGAGVDVARFPALALPPVSPLRIAVVSRMLWSKGIDLVVEAVSAARAQGAPVELSLFGESDPSNPRAISRDTLREWSAREGIFWHGFSSDVAAVWADHHVACLVSRGGEGLPRTLLEAAACARPILTSDVPGCRDFVRNGVDGFVVPPNDVAALTSRILELAEMGLPKLQAMGESARSCVEDGYTESNVREAVGEVYRRWL